MRNFNLDVRVRTLEPGERSSGDFPGRCDIQPYGEGAGGLVPDGSHSLVEAPERLEGACQERLALSGQAHPAAGALQQSHAEQVLELADLRAQNLLRHMNPPGSRGEAALRGDSREVAKMAEFDAHGDSSVATPHQ